jgi:outer membrane protein insertion porin family
LVRTLVFSLILLIFIVPTPAHAFSTDLDLEGKPITSILVSAKNLTPQDVSRMTGLSVGMPFSPREVQKTLQPLYQTGLFRNIQIEAEPSEDGVVLKFIFNEKVFISKIHITGHSFSTKKILNALNLHEGEEFSTENWRKALSRLLNFYHRQGYFQPKITMKTIPQAQKNTVDLEIQVQQGERTKLGKILFTGDRALPDVLLYFTLGVTEGSYNADKIEKGLNKLNRLYQNRGYIQATIGPPELAYDEKNQEVSVNIPIESGIQVKIYFKGNFEKETFSWRKPLEAQLLIKEERSIEANILDESSMRLERYFKDQGYLFVKVSYQREDQPEKKLVNITFEIESGHPVLLMSTRFEGNQNIAAKDLKKVIQIQSTGILIPHVVQEKTIQADIKALQAYYQSRGFLQAQIKDGLTFSPEKDRADLVFQIEEGVQTLLGQIKFEGNHVFQDSELLKVSGLKPQTPYNAAESLEAVLKILSHYSKMGYAFAQASYTPEFKDQNHYVDLHYQIDESIQAFVGKIFLQGNTVTEDHVIMRELVIHPNDLYDEEKIRLSEQRLYRLGFLGEIRLNPLSEEKKSIRDLLLSVKERKAGSVDFGLGYGEEEHLRGFLEVTHRNLFGTGRRINLRGEASSIERKYALNYKEPWLFSMVMDGRAGLVYQFEKQVAFDKRTIGGNLGIDKSFTERTKASLQYLYEQNECEDIEDVAVLTPEDQQRITIGSINPSVVRDSRDDPFDPTSGSVNGIIIKDSSKILGSETQFVKVTVQSSWYRPVSKWLVLALSSRAGIAQKFGETEAIHCSERFFLGGRSTIRGYSLNTVGVPGQTLILPKLKPTGGNAMFLVNGELRFRLLKRVGVVLFLDGGNVWLEYPDMQLSDFKYSTGAGIRFNTPVGPLRLDWGYKLEPEVGESQSEWHFTLGHTF